MKINQAEFTISAVRPEQYPNDGFPEIICIGASNVGKSSLINNLINRKKLAKTSSVPGKTRLINFYKINGESKDPFFFVDLPGFGYAKVSKAEQKKWQPMMDEYLSDRPQIRLALFIQDIRREPGEREKNIYFWLDSLNIPVLTVLTKCDKFTSNKRAKSKAIYTKKLSEWLEGPNSAGMVMYSSHTGDGKSTLWGHIADALSGDIVDID